MNSNNLSPYSGGTSSSARGIDTARKVPLGEGRSLMDWIRNAPKMTRRAREVSIEELSKHNTETDCWLSVRDIVYDVTEYIDYHPGGKDQIMRGAGIDATELFNQYHSWVNIESMLKTCIIGKLAFSPPLASNFKTPLAPLMPALALSSAQFAAGPFFDWIQDDESLKLFINTKVDNFKKENVTILHYLTSNEFYVFVYLTEKLYNVCYELQHKIKAFKFDISGKTLTVSLIKCDKGKPWTKIGKPLPTNKVIANIKDVKKLSFLSKLTHKRKITHDSHLFTLDVPSNVFMQVAIGRHVYISLPGQPELIRPYTPVPESFAEKYPREQNSSQATQNSLHLLIKIYDDGQLTPDLNRVPIGNEVIMSIQDGNFNPSRLLDAENVSLLAAGTGITPILGVIDYCLKQKFIETRKIHLVCLNKSQSDILFKEVLESWKEEFSAQLTVDHVLSSPNENWKGHTGRISKELILKLLPNVKTECADDPESLICICGPGAFTDKSVEILTEQLDIPMYNIYTFRG